MKQEDCAFRSLDGLRLAGDLVRPSNGAGRTVVLVHGAGVDRHEDGFYDQAVDTLVSAGFGAFRFDLRGHGESEGGPEELTIAGALSDILAAWLHARTLTGEVPTCALASSFGGGLLALAAARLALERIVLVNPLLKFRARFLESKAFWSARGLSEEAQEVLEADGVLTHVAPIVMSRAFINDVVWLDPFELATSMAARVLVLHGTEDSRAPFKAAEEWSGRVGARLKAFEGAEHGLCVAGDDEFTNPRTLEWQREALEQAVAFFAEALPA